MSKAKGLPGKKLKPVKGKSTTGQATAAASYKPNMWFDGKQIPKGMETAKPGDTITMTVQAKVVRKAEGLGANDRSLTVELEKMAVQPAKK